LVKVSLLVPIFDTNIFRFVAEGKISPCDWRRARRAAPRTGWPLSGLTFYELLLGLHRSDESGFPKSKEPVTLAYHSSKGRVLPLPGLFLWERCHRKRHRNSAAQRKQLESSLKLATIARSRVALASGGVPWPNAIHPGTEYGVVDLNHVAAAIEQPEQKFVARMLQVRDEAYAQHGITKLGEPPDSWASLKDKINRDCDAGVWRKSAAADILKILGVQCSEDESLIFSAKIDASTTLSQNILRMLMLSPYDLDADRSVYRDIFQLLYLADDKYYFVTEDNRLRHHMSSSIQQGRVITFGQLLALL